MKFLLPFSSFIYFPKSDKKFVEIKLYRKILSSFVSLLCETGPIPLQRPFFTVALTLGSIQEVYPMSDHDQWSCSRVVYLSAVNIWTLYHQTGGWFMKINCKGLGSDLIEILFQAFAWRDWRKPRNTSVRIAGVPIRIWTVFPKNTSVQLCRLPSLLGEPIILRLLLKYFELLLL
jgi:hypothetical protein